MKRILLGLCALLLCAACSKKTEEAPDATAAPKEGVSAIGVNTQLGSVQVGSDNVVRMNGPLGKMQVGKDGIQVELAEDFNEQLEKRTSKGK